MSKADILEMVQNEAAPPTNDHGVFHRGAMDAAISVIRHFEAARDKLAKDDTPDNRGQYNAVCISLGKTLSLCVGLTVGMSENPRYETRLLLSFIILFINDLVQGDILPTKEELEFARKLAQTFEPYGAVH